MPYAPMYEPPSDRPGEQFFYYSTNALMLAQGGVSLYNSGRSAYNTIRSGGQAFEAYKISRGGNQLLAEIQTTNKAGQTILYPIRTEYHHMFLTQRFQRAHNLPNWLVNNRVNVFRLNTIQHSLVDSYRFRLLPVGLKPRVGWTKEFNFFTSF